MSTANAEKRALMSTLPGDDVRQIMWRFTDRYDLQMVIQSARSVARGVVAHMVADKQRHTHEWTPEKAAMLGERAIARMWKSFKVYCWGCNFSDQVTPAPDPALDYDAAQALSEIVWQSCQAIAAGVWRGEGTVAIDGQGNVPTLVRLGRVFIFDLALDTSVLDTALQFAPSGVEQGPGKVNVVVDGVAVQAYP